MREGQSAVIYRADYQAPAYWIDSVELCFDLDPAKTRVLNRMKLRRNADVPRQPLFTVSAVNLDRPKFIRLVGKRLYCPTCRPSVSPSLKRRPQKSAGLPRIT